MKLYNSLGPNPHVVRMFAAEKGIVLPLQAVDVMNAEHRRPPYGDRVNTMLQTPALETDDGTVICEVTAICEYLDELTLAHCWWAPRRPSAPRPACGYAAST